MTCLIIVRFRDRDPLPVYQRFRAPDPGMLEGLRVVASWITTDSTRCYQIMEAASRGVLFRWMARWSDLMDFEIIPVLASAQVPGRPGARLTP